MGKKKSLVHNAAYVTDMSDVYKTANIDRKLWDGVRGHQLLIRRIMICGYAVDKL